MVTYAAETGRKCRNHRVFSFISYSSHCKDELVLIFYCLRLKQVHPLILFSIQGEPQFVILKGENKGIYFYLKEATTLHSSILSKEHLQWNFIIEVGHWLLIIFHSNLQKWAWGTLRHILKHNHGQKSPSWCPRLQKWNLVDIKVLIKPRKIVKHQNEDKRCQNEGLKPPSPKSIYQHVEKKHLITTCKGPAAARPNVFLLNWIMNPSSGICEPFSNNRL